MYGIGIGIGIGIARYSEVDGYESSGWIPTSWNILSSFVLVDFDNASGNVGRVVYYV